MRNFQLILTVCTLVKSKGKLSQNFVAFSEYMNFIKKVLTCFELSIDKKSAQIAFSGFLEGVIVKNSE